MQSNNMTISRRNILKSLLILGASPLEVSKPAAKEKKFQFVGLGYGGTNMMLKLLDEKQPGIYTSICAEERTNLSVPVNTYSYNVPGEVEEQHGYFTITSQDHYSRKGRPEKLSNILSPNCTKVFFVGLGGYTGTSLAASISNIFYQRNEFFYMIAAIPFRYEGKKRNKSSLLAAGVIEKCPGFIAYHADDARRRFGSRTISECWNKSDAIAVEKFKIFVL